MKRSKLVVFLMLLSLAFSWFVSVGVVSAENPWDADAPSSPGSSDTTTSPTTDLRPSDDGRDSAGSGFDAMQDWLVRMYIAVYFQTMGFNTMSTVTGDDGGKSQTTTSSVR
jgi:hypothetical protein